MRKGRWLPRGFILATVFLVLVVIVLLLGALFRLVPQEVRWIGDQRRETVAYYVASGGVKHALAWLRQVRTQVGGVNEPFQRNLSSDPYAVVSESQPQRSPLRLVPQVSTGRPEDSFFPAGLSILRSKPGRIRFPGNWAAEVFIVPDHRTRPHPALGGQAGQLPCYVIVSAAYRDLNDNGQCDSGSGENYALRIEASALERTFASYAYFVDLWPDRGAQTTAFRFQPSQTQAIFEGPVHCNDTPVIEVVEPNRFWSQAAAQPPFQDELSFAGDLGPPKAPDSYDGLAYMGGNFLGSSPLYRPYSGGGPYQADPDRYLRLFRQGQSALRQTQRVVLPSDWRSLAESAWGTPAGRASPPAELASGLVQVNSQDLGIVSTGSLRELRLDVVDAQGNSLVFRGQGVSQVLGSGNPVIHLVQSEQITYLDGVKDVYDEVPQIVNGPYTTTLKEYSDTPTVGFQSESYRVQVGQVAREVKKVIQTGTRLVQDSPGGNGPASGGFITVPIYTTEITTLNVPLYETRIRYVRETQVSGVGPHEVMVRQLVGQEPNDVNFYPSDTIVTASESDVLFPTNYFVAGPVDAANFPVFSGAADGVEILVPKGKTLVVSQDRVTGRTYQARLLDGKPSGFLGVYGQIQRLHGTNYGAKTIFAAQSDAERLNPKQLANILIADQLLQFDTPRGALPSKSGHALGIIGQNIFLPSSESALDRFRTPAEAQYLYASLFAAQGGFSAQSIADGVGLAELRVVGGVVQKEIGTLLTGNRGWSSAYRYDRFLRLHPPPGFPSDGRYQLTFFRVTQP